MTMAQVRTTIAPKKGKKTRYMVVLRSRQTGGMIATFNVFGIGKTPQDAKKDAQRQARSVYRDITFAVEDVVRHPMGNGHILGTKPSTTKAVS